jgi:phage host-nuclease inhibitor protein Gam
MNIDIDTATAPPALTITDDKQLCDIVYQLASKQLVINAAEAEQQASVEAAKKAFADATGPLAEEIKSLFSAVAAYAAANKDRLFPVKAGKRRKTFAVMQHKLQYRSADSVEAPANAVDLLRAVIWDLECSAQKAALEGESPASYEAAVSALEQLIRQPAPELDKEAVKALSREDAKRMIAAQGIRISTQETFKLAFSFTPEQAAA